MSPALLFDLDGTLVDSRADLASAVNALLQSHGLRPLPIEQVAGFVGNGARSLIRRALAVADPGGAVPREDSTYRAFLGHYRAVMLDSTLPFPGVEATLKELVARSVPLAVVTNKPEQPARVILDALGLSPYFGSIIGGDTAARRKPHAEPIWRAAAELEVPLNRCVMLGDSDVDIAAAGNASIPGIWCAWGGIHPDRPAEAKHVAQTFEQAVALALELGSPASG